MTILLFLHRIVRGLALLMAAVGALVLAALIVMICLSILGRAAFTILNSAFVQNLAPAAAQWLIDHGVRSIRGDYELIEFSMPFVIFAFLCWCQATAGHASVDIFTDGLRPWAKRVLLAVIELAFAAALIVIAVKLQDGMLTQQRRRGTTFLLQLPVWWSYLAAVIPAYFAAGIGIWMAFVRLIEAATNRSLIEAQAGADH